MISEKQIQKLSSDDIIDILLEEQQALEEYTKIATRILELSEYSFEETTQIELLCNIAKMMSKSGNIEESNQIYNRAFQLAKSLTNEKEKAIALSEIAECKAIMGNYKDARLILNNAYQLTRNIPIFCPSSDDLLDFDGDIKITINFYDILFDKILSSFLHMERAEWTKKYAKEIIGRLKALPDEDKEDLPHFKDINYDLCLKGDSAFKVGFINSSDQPMDYVKKMIEIGVEKETIAFVKDIASHNDWDGAKSLAAAAEAIKLSESSRKGDDLYTEAVYIARRASAQRAKVDILSYIGSSMARSGDIKKAKAIFSEAIGELKEVNSESWRGWISSNIVKGLSSIGEFDKAKVLAENVSDCDWREISFGYLIIYRALQSGIFDKKTIDEISSTPIKIWILSEVGKSLVKNGKYQDGIHSYLDSIGYIENIREDRARNSLLNIAVKNMDIPSNYVKIPSDMYKILENIKKNDLTNFIDLERPLKNTISTFIGSKENRQKITGEDTKTFARRVDLSIRFKNELEDIVGNNGLPKSQGVLEEINKYKEDIWNKKINVVEKSMGDKISEIKQKMMYMEYETDWQSADTKGKIQIFENTINKFSNKSAINESIDDLIELRAEIDDMWNELSNENLSKEGRKQVNKIFWKVFKQGDQNGR